MKITFILIVLIVGLIVSIGACAQQGSLDKTFGTNGIFLKNFTEPLTASFYKGLVQTDDKIVEVGNGESTFGAVQYLADGSTDNSFGDSGFALINLPFEEHAEAHGVAQQSDDKLLLTGWATHDFPDDIYDGLIVRINADGSIDSSFGIDGVIQRTAKKHYNAGFGPIVVFPDNSFIAAGNSDGSKYINRFTKDGILDQSFGQNGYVYLDFNFGVATCKIQNDGKIVLAGSYNYGGTERFSLQRLLPDGSIDESFGTDGIVTTSNGLIGDLLVDMAFQSDGKIVVTGNEGYYYIVNARYTTDGKLDSTFAVNGKSSVMLPNTGLFADGIAITSNDEIILGGTTLSTDLLTADYAIIKLSSNGVIDSSFGDSGETFTDFGIGFQDQIISIGLQHSGKIIAIGNSTNGGIYYSSLARYNDDESKKQIIITKIKHWIQHHNGFTWDNNSSINSYVVQRSYDGIHFSAIARINAGSQSNFAYADPMPLRGNNYYRLQTTSISGAVTNSNVIAVTNDDIKISPNPATNSLHIEGLSNQKVQLSVVDFSGNIKLQTITNGSTYNLNIASLKPGNYLLKIELKGDVVTKSFVKE